MGRGQLSYQLQNLSLCPEHQHIYLDAVSARDIRLWVLTGKVISLHFRCVCVYVSQLCVTFCETMDCSPQVSSVHGILQARIQEWVVTPFPRGSSQPRDQTQVSHTAGGFFTIWAIRDTGQILLPQTQQIQAKLPITDLESDRNVDPVLNPNVMKVAQELKEQDSPDQIPKLQPASNTLTE